MNSDDTKEPNRTPGDTEPKDQPSGQVPQPSDQPQPVPPWGTQPGWQQPQQGWPPANQPGWGSYGTGPSWPSPSWPPAAQPQYPPAAPQNPWPPAAQPQYPPAAQNPWTQPSWPPAPAQPWSPDPAQPWSPRAATDSNAPRRSRLPMFAGVIVAALIAFSVGMVVDRAVVATEQQPLQGFEVYQEALRDIRANYVGRNDVTDEQLLHGSIKGLVESLGDTNHSRFLTPQEYAQFKNDLTGSVAGIGVILNTDNGATTVDRVITGSPAEKAGVRAGDTITAVNGKSTAGLTYDQLAPQIRGKPGTQVTITVVHAGSTEPVDITITRALIQAPIVDWGMVPGTTVADIALFEFADGASDEVHKAIVDAQAAGATAIVLDMRGNPGGLAIEARAVASEFLSSGTIYQEEDASGNRTKVTVDKSRKATTLPLVVLVDGNTASAAEIVAGAMQDNKRARIIGMTTVGTGTVLLPFVLSDGSAILLGISDWLTPNGNRIFGIGIKPDQTVALPTGGQPIDPTKLDKMTAGSVITSGDSQLLAALTELNQVPK